MTAAADPPGDRVREVTVAVTSLWSAPADETAERLTQLLAGEPAEVLEQRDGWCRVVAPWQASSRDPRGYPGWLRAGDLGPPAARSATATPPSYDVGAVLDAARQLLGVPYLWGGMSAQGIDCSGLVHLAWRGRGVLLPRDAADQAAHPGVRPVALDAVQAGDLYFFARPDQEVHHVGFAARPADGSGERWILHAPAAGGHVEEVPLTRERLADLVSAGRVAPSAP